MWKRSARLGCASGPDRLMLTNKRTIPRPPPTSPGFVLVLNGCSSSGKTSIAKVLQDSQPLALLHLQLDVFRAMEPQGYFDPDQRDQAPLRVAALCRAMHAATREYVLHGQNVILDHVLSAEAWQYLLEDFVGLPVYLVAVQCELAEAERREAERHDRTPGLARSQWSHIHGGRTYDCTVDTTRAAATSCAAQVLAWLRHRPTPFAFTTMQGRQGRP